MRAHPLFMIARTFGTVDSADILGDYRWTNAGMIKSLCASKTALLLVYIPVFPFHKSMYFLCLFASTVFFSLIVRTHSPKSTMIRSKQTSSSLNCIYANFTLLTLFHCIRIKIIMKQQNIRLARFFSGIWYCVQHNIYMILRTHNSKAYICCVYYCLNTW